MKLTTRQQLLLKKRLKAKIEECYRCGKARLIGSKVWHKDLNTFGHPIRRVVCEQCR